MLTRCWKMHFSYIPIGYITLLSFPPGTARCFTINTLILFFSFFLPSPISTSLPPSTPSTPPPTLAQGQVTSADTPTGRSWKSSRLRMLPHFAPDVFWVCSDCWGTGLGTAGTATKHSAIAYVMPLTCGWYQKDTRHSLRIVCHDVCCVGSGAKQGGDGGRQQRSHCGSKHTVGCGVFSVIVSHTTHCKSEPAFSHGEKKKRKKNVIQRAFLATFYSTLQSHYSNCLKLQASWNGAGLPNSASLLPLPSPSCHSSQVPQAEGISALSVAGNPGHGGVPEVKYCCTCRGQNEQQLLRGTELPSTQLREDQPLRCYRCTERYISPPTSQTSGGDLDSSKVSVLVLAEVWEIKRIFLSLH